MSDDEKPVLQRVQEEQRIEITSYTSRDRLVVYCILVFVLLNCILLVLNFIGVIT